jgi:Malectin domain
MLRKFTTCCVIVAALCLVASLFTNAYADFPATQPTTQASDGAVRVKAGADQAFTDPHGHKWEADTGSEGGSTVERDADLKIENTDMPAFYRNEHYDMTSWTRDLPNGKYTVKLYFCETYDGIAAAGDRVFGVDVAGQKLKDFDVFKEAGGANKPLIKTFENVPVTDGKLKITFEANTQSPQINGIEVIPAK